MIIREIDTQDRDSADLGAWYQMRLERLAVWLPPCRKYRFDSFLDGLSEREAMNWRWRVWLAELPGVASPVGFSELSLAPNDSGHSYASVDVRPEFRRRGIGTEFFRILKAAAVGESRERIGGPSHGMPTDPARPFFATFGIKPLMGPAIHIGSSLSEALQKLDSSELPRRPILSSSLHPAILTQEEFSILVSLGAIDTTPKAGQLPELPPYETFVRQMESRSNSPFPSMHWVVLRDPADESAVAAAAIHTGDWPIARFSFPAASEAADPATRFAVVEALLTTIRNSFPTVERVFVMQRSAYIAELKALGFAPAFEFNSWRVEL